MSNNNANKSVTIEVETPDGVLYFTVVEDNSGRPCRVISIIGKSGSSLAAWAEAVDQLINLAFSKGAGINDILEALSNISTSKPIRSLRPTLVVKSAPDGIVVALSAYKREKYKEHVRMLGGLSDTDDNEEDSTYARSSIS